MIDNWLKPVDTGLLEYADSLPEYTFGRQALLLRQEVPSLKGVHVALIGISELEANEIRRNLYPSVYAFPAGSVADLGNLRKPEPSLLIPLLYELLSGHILPVLIGGRDDMARAQFLAYQDAKALVNLAAVDERFRFAPQEKSSSEVYTSLLQPRHPLLFHFSLIGYQVHQTAPAGLDFLEKNYFDAVRLGKTRTAIEETEPVIRDADLLAFHLSALNQSEAPGVPGASPSGYFLEEACQLCRYAGMSDKLSSFGIYGYSAALDRERQTAQAAAQMCWYFLEGFFNRKKDYPVSSNGLTEYIFELPTHNYQITFLRSYKSGRWWMEVPVPSKKMHQRHRLVP